MAKTLAQTIAGHTRQSVARDIAVAMEDQAVLDALSSGLCNDAFFLKHFVKKTPVATAKDAVRNGLTDVQLKHFLSTEKRSSVLTVWVDYQHPTWDTLCQPELAHLLKMENVDKLLASKAGAGLLYADELAARPADSFGPGLRAWRLTSPLLDDAEVLAEVLSFDDWGQKFLPQALSFVVADRPHLLPDIVAQLTTATGDDGELMIHGESLRVQIAGSYRFGLLDVDQQCALILVDEVAAKQIGEEDDRFRFLFMSAQGNPFTKMETLRRLAVATDNEFLTRTRDKFQPYDLNSLDDVTDADRMARMVRWAAPTRDRNGKPAVIPELVKHPLLEIADAETLTMHLGETNHITWVAPRITQAWRDLEARFPESEFLADTAAETLQGTVRKGYWMFEDCTGAVDLPTEDDSDLTVQHVPEYVAGYTVKSLLDSYGAQVGTSYLDAHFGDDEDAWKTFFATAPAVPDLTLEDVTALCAAVRA